MSKKFWEHKKVREWSNYVRNIKDSEMAVFEFIWDKKFNQNETIQRCIYLCEDELDKGENGYFKEFIGEDGSIPISISPSIFYGNARHKSRPGLLKKWPGKDSKDRYESMNWFFKNEIQKIILGDRVAVLMRESTKLRQMGNHEGAAVLEQQANSLMIDKLGQRSQVIVDDMEKYEDALVTKLIEFAEKKQKELEESDEWYKDNKIIEEFFEIYNEYYPDFMQRSLAKVLEIKESSEENEKIAIEEIFPVIRIVLDFFNKSGIDFAMISEHVNNKKSFNDIDDHYEFSKQAKLFVDLHNEFAGEAEYMASQFKNIQYKFIERVAVLNNYGEGEHIDIDPNNSQNDFISLKKRMQILSDFFTQDINIIIGILIRSQQELNIDIGSSDKSSIRAFNNLSFREIFRFSARIKRITEMIIMSLLQFKISETEYATLSGVLKNNAKTGTSISEPLEYKSKKYDEDVWQKDIENLKITLSDINTETTWRGKNKSKKDKRNKMVYENFIERDTHSYFLENQYETLINEATDMGSKNAFFYLLRKFVDS